ncbi:hypothetical protein [Natronorubrum sp. DTA28]|uniref:hypothetical protein n=1 Tax=Natronorubrum sp. DTA28 TaxID=3447019 RepID=UPI003F84AC28
MPTQTPVGFSFEAFLTRVVPGLVLMSPVLLALFLTSPIEINPSNTNLLLVSLMALIFGELIEQLRSGLFRVPLPFTHSIYTATGDESHLPTWYQYLKKIDERFPDIVGSIKESNDEDLLGERFNFDLQNEMEEKFELNPDSALPRDFYDSLLLYLGDDLSSRTRNYFNLYVFNTNLKVATILSLPLYTYYIGIQYPDTEMWMFIISATILLTIVFLITQFLKASPYLYVEMLFKEFYMRGKSK